MKQPIKSQIILIKVIESNKFDNVHNKIWQREFTTWKYKVKLSAEAANGSVL